MSNIWIVDDDAEMRGAVELMLKVLEHQPQGFSNAPAAAEGLLSGPAPDVMLVDVNMPEVSGLDLVEFIRRRGQWKELCVLMLSTEASDVTVDRALRLGADGYITKPVTIEELERSLRSAREKRRKGVI